MFRRAFLMFALQQLVMMTAAAQTVWPPALFVPPAPTELDGIRANFDVPQDPIANSTTVTGTLVRTDVTLGPGIIGPPPVIVPYSVVFGPLPANTYTYEIYLHFADGTVELRSRQTLVVSAASAAIPAMSRTFLLVLMLSLAVVAALTVGRMSG